MRAGRATGGAGDGRGGRRVGDGTRGTWDVGARTRGHVGDAGDVSDAGRTPGETRQGNSKKP